jgi:hypothetical protein
MQTTQTTQAMQRGSSLCLFCLSYFFFQRA